MLRMCSVLFQLVDQRRQVGDRVDNVIGPCCAAGLPSRGRAEWRFFRIWQGGPKSSGVSPTWLPDSATPTVTQPAATPSAMPGSVSSTLMTAWGG